MHNNFKMEENSNYKSNRSQTNIELQFQLNVFTTLNSMKWEITTSLHSPFLKHGGIRSLSRFNTTLCIHKTVFTSAFQ